MQGDLEFTVTGRLGQDPALDYPGNTTKCEILVITNPRYFDKDTNAWKDGESSGWYIATWGALAEHVAQSLKKGDRVTVTGTQVRRKWTDGEGKDRWGTDLKADDVMASLKWNDVKVVKTERASTGAAPTGGSNDDPWSMG